MIPHDFFPKLGKLLTAITRGDYSAGRKVEEFLDPEKYPPEVVEFTESLNMMTVKLEAREESLKNTIGELEKKNAALKESIEKREFLSSFFAGVLFLIIGYIFVLSLVQQVPFLNRISARMIELSAVLLGIYIIRRSRMPLRDFGLNLHNWKRSLLDGLLFSFLVIMIMFALKWYLFKNQVKGFDSVFFMYPLNSLPTYLYVPISLLQEFLSKGIIQTAILISIVHRHKNFMAVFIASAIFGSVHANYSFILALTTMLLSIGWGYIYLKRPTIVGISLSHYLIGVAAWMLGFWDYVTGNPF
jgi:hypothetical protein